MHTHEAVLLYHTHVEREEDSETNAGLVNYCQGDRKDRPGIFSEETYWSWAYFPSR